MASLLVVDDEQSMREFLEILLKRGGHRVASLGNAAAALARVEEGGIDLVLCDLRLGADSGMEVLRRVKERSPATEVVMITAFATAENAIQAMKLGAYDYVLKPFKVDELTLVVEKALEHRALLQENRVLRHRVGDRPPIAPGLLGRTPAIEEIRALVGKVAATRTTVLITGESGTGKEVVARAIHAAGDRADLPFVAVNCGAVPEGLIESEFFGHVRGAFTGAAEARPGLFEVAGSGTLFLDEVGELPPPVQVKLLRAVQEWRIRRVGGTTDIVISARILAATNRDLGEEVKAGRFREDLFYRLNVVRLVVPPLRERPDDVVLLARTFLDRFATRFGVEALRVPPALLDRLRAHNWPGNVRELENALESLVALSPPEGLDLSLLPFGRGEAVPAEEGPLSLKQRVEAYERGLVYESLKGALGNRSEAARGLGISRVTLHDKLKKYGLGGDEEG